MTLLCEQTRESSLVELGVSPRGVIALSQLARARAILKRENLCGFLEDVQNVFVDVCAHRVILRPQAKIEGVTAQKLLEDILSRIEPPFILEMKRKYEGSRICGNVE